LQAIRDAIDFKNGGQAYSVVYKFYGRYLSSNRAELTFHYANEFIKNSEYPYLINRAKSKAIKAYRNNIANSNDSFHVDNYFNNSYGIFKGCKAPNRTPDFVSPSGSKYWYGSDKNGAFVIRKSNHWSKLGNKKYNKMERITIDGKEYGKIPFDLARWQSGDFVKVVTRDGRDVEQLTHFKGLRHFQLRGVIVDGLLSYDLKGCNVNENTEAPADLHLIIELPQPKEYWQNVYIHEDKPTINFMGTERPSQNAADKNVDDASVRIGYFKTTIVEGEKPKYEFIPL